MQKKRILPPRIFMSSIILIVVIHLLLPILRILYFPWNLFGLLLLALGGILNLLADKAFKRLNTTVKPFEFSSELVTSGVFRLSRNPMYLGMSMFLFGESILFGSLSPFLITIIFLIIMHFTFIKVEEEMLMEKFQKEYIFYKEKVRRWI